MASIVYTVLLIVSIFYLVRKKQEVESIFSLKIIGYFILGSFAFIYNGAALPLGFTLYVLFLRPTLNIDVKRTAALIGLLTFVIVHWLLPAWESRPIVIKHELDSIYSMDFTKEYELIRERLKLNHSHTKLEYFRANYTKNGDFTNLSWKLLDKNDHHFNLYYIRFELDKSRYSIMKTQIEPWHQFDRLIEASRFFENLNKLDLKQITLAKGTHPSYGISSSGEKVNHAVENTTNFLVTNDGIRILDDDQLPIEAYDITIYAMRKTGETRNDKGLLIGESFESTAYTTYLYED